MNLDAPAERLSVAARMWRIVHTASEAMSAKEVEHVLAAQGIVEKCVGSYLRQMVQRGHMEDYGTQPVAGSNRKEMLFVTLGEHYPSKTGRRPAPAQNAQRPQPAPAAPPPGRVFWKQHEIEALCLHWAKSHLSVGTALSELGLMKVCQQEGHGFRCKTIPRAKARLFAEQHQSIVRADVQALRQRAEPPAARPASVAPTDLHAIVMQAVTAALAAQQERFTAVVAGLLQGLPGYQRPKVVVPATATETAAEPKPKQFQVLVVNAMAAQFQSVQRAFPTLDLRLSNGRVPTEQSPDLVISMIKFMNHPLDHALKKKYGPRYHPVNGAAESIKLAIQQRLQVPYAH